MDASEAAAVLARARQGDAEAFRVLIERHSRSVFRLAYRMTGNEQDAEDVVQESFLRAYRQLGRFESRANFGTWLYRIVSNCSADLMRAKQARHRQVRGESRDHAAAEPGIVTHHFTEDDLTLYYYGEGPYRVDRMGNRSARRRVDQHLESCPACASLYREIAGTLAMVVAPEVPERGDQYGLEVWQRIRHKLPEQDAPWWTALFRYDRLALAAATALLVVAAFVAGLTWRQPGARS